MYAVLFLLWFGANMYVDKSTSQLAQSRGMEILKDLLFVIVMAMLVAMAVYNQVITWRVSPRMWWRKLRRNTLTAGITLIIVAVIIYLNKEDMSLLLSIISAGVASLVASLTAHIRLRRWVSE